MSIGSHIERLQRESEKARAELGRIERLRREFPDLETDTDRWGRVRYMARSANARVDRVLFHRNCGCCPDSPLHARPYLDFEGETIHSNPCDVMVGNPCSWGGGFQERTGWRKTYEDAGVSFRVVEEIQRHVEYLAAAEGEGEDEEDED